MKKLFQLLLFIFVALFTVQIAQAEDYRVLVLPDNIQFDSTNYFIYPDSSVIFASDTINEIKKDGRVQTVSMSEVRDALRKNQRLGVLTKRALKEYKYNYNIPFVDFKAIASYFSTNKVLIITSQTDVQNYALRRSIWDILNFPGEAVINSAYKLSTFASLIDVDKEQVVWQKTYYKILSTKDNRIIAQNFAPATEQLEQIKSYSTVLLTPEIAKIVEFKILPPPLPIQKESNVVEISNPSQNNSMGLSKEEMDLKPKAPPLRPTTSTLDKNTGEIINDL